MATKLKIIRRFQALESATHLGINKFRRETVLPAVPLQDIGPCPVCGDSLMVAVGQQIRFHAECRKEGRRLYGRATQVVEVDKYGVAIKKR